MNFDAAPTPAHWKNRLLAYYRRHRERLNVAFFLGGFLFDVVTLSTVDNPWGIAQQLAYLGAIGWLLSKELLFEAKLWAPSKRLEKVWAYRVLLVHFMLGSLISLYSLFFLKSASLASSLLFIALLLGVLVANELPRVQSAGLGLKVALYALCLFSFFSMLWPTFLGFVGRVPFALSLASAGAAVASMALWVYRRFPNPRRVSRRILMPGAALGALTVAFYFLGWIPPVPLAVVDMGIYHNVEKRGDRYWLFHERPTWALWRKGDQDFVARPGEAVYFFARIYSPARFSDELTLHWYWRDPRRGWVSSDRIPMKILGGRREGFRGFSYKQNHAPGDWRVKVETTDGREIGRLRFRLRTDDRPAAPGRFKVDVQ
ncbi:MAG TPA: DUF2914 domain-containing protein [Elusimicrobiota bacterium]|nr:DUF2914 domain-containing protein [Elusimicrobiota bacterium]